MVVVVVCVGRRGRWDLFPDAFACLRHDIADGKPRGLRCLLCFSDAAHPPLGCGHRSLVDGCPGSHAALPVVCRRADSPGDHSSNNLGEKSVRDHLTPSSRSEVATDAAAAPSGAQLVA